MGAKDPADVLGIDIMFGIIDDAKIMSRAIVEKKYQESLGRDKSEYLKRYLDRIYL